MTLLLLACAPLSGDLVLTDDNSYRYDGTLSVGATDVTAGADVRVDWSELHTDMRGREVQEVQQAALLAFSLEQDEVLTAIAENELLQSDIHDFRIFDNSGGATEAVLSDFSILGNFFDPPNDFVEREGTWTWSVSLINLDEGKRDFLSLRFLVLSDSADTELLIDDSSADLDVSADLHSAEALRTSPEQVYTLDWSALTQDGLGKEVDLDLVDRLIVGRLDVDDVAGVEARFLDLLGQASEYYRLDVSGQTRADLAEASDPDGNSFGGFTDEGMWLVGLECTTCTSPAPIALAIVELAR